MNDQPAYGVKIGCSNCHNEWAETFFPKDEVEGTWEGLYVHDRRCTHKIGCHGCQFCHPVMCPVCKSLKVHAKDRYPLKGDDK